MELPPLDEYIARISRITGVDLNDDDSEMDLTWTSRREAKLLSARLSVMQHRLLALHSEMDETIKRYEASHPTPRASAAREHQERLIALYLKVKFTISKQVELFDDIKQTIEKSLASEPHPPDPYPNLVASDLTTEYFLFMNEEVQGPFQLLDLLAERDSGLLSNETLCCLAGTEKWCPFGEMVNNL